MSDDTAINYMELSNVEFVENVQWLVMGISDVLRDRLIALARDGIKWREYRNAPDPLGHALNSGDGVYRP